MKPSTVLFDERAWWQRPRPLLAATLVPLAIVIAATWWAASTPTVRSGAAVAGAVRPLPAATRPSALMLKAQEMTPPPLPAAAVSSAAVPAPPTPPSYQVAPGVHMTPLSVPAGTVPMPAGPNPHDSESEN